MSTLRLGDNFGLVYDSNVPSVVTSPTWTQAQCIGNLSLDLSRPIVEMPCRGDKRVGGLPAKLTMPMSASIYFDNDDPSEGQWFRERALAGDKIFLAIVEYATDAQVEGVDEVSHIEDQFYIGDFPMDLAGGQDASFEMTFIPAADVHPLLKNVIGTWQAGAPG